MASSLPDGALRDRRHPRAAVGRIGGSRSVNVSNDADPAHRDALGPETGRQRRRQGSLECAAPVGEPLPAPVVPQPGTERLVSLHALALNILLLNCQQGVRCRGARLELAILYRAVRGRRGTDPPAGRAPVVQHSRHQSAGAPIARRRRLQVNCTERFENAKVANADARRNIPAWAHVTFRRLLIDPC